MVTVGNNWLRTFLVCHHLGRNWELALGKWEIIWGGGSWRLPCVCSSPGPTARERRFGNSWRSGTSPAVPMGCDCTIGSGIWGGNGAGDPRASCPPAPGHWDPLQTPAGAFPVFSHFAVRDKQAGSWHPRSSSSWAQSGLWDSLLGTAPELRVVPLTLCWECSSQAAWGSPAAPWDVPALTPAPIPFQGSSQGSQTASPMGISRAGPGAGGGNTQQCQWGV